MTNLAIIGLVDFFCGFFAGFVAGEKGYGSFAWLLLGWITGPIALVATAGLPVKAQVSHSKTAP